MLRLLAVCLCSLTMMTAPLAGELVLRPGEPFDQAAVERLLQAPLADALAADAVRIAVARPGLPLANPYAADAELRLGTLTMLPRDRFMAEIVIRTDAVTPMTLRLEGEVAAVVAIPVPAAALAVGSIVTAADLDVAWHADSRLRADWILAADELIGQEVRRPLAQGRPVVRQAVGAPIVVRRGDEVILIYRRGALTLETQAMAQRDGALGERIPARNPATGAVVEGRVVDAHTLLMETGR